MSAIQLEHDYSKIPHEEQKETEQTKSNRNCCVPACTMNGYPVIKGHGKISYHLFPPVGDPLRKRWLIKIRRDEDSTFKITSNTAVCSLHFTPDQLELHGFSGRRSKVPGCVPTLFECWKDLKHIYKQPKVRPSNKLQQSHLTETSIVKSNITEFEPCEIEEKLSSVSVCESLDNNSHLLDEIKRLKLKLEKTESDFAKCTSENNNLKQKIKETEFSVENTEDKDFSFYTGFASKAVFVEVLKFLNPGQNGENIKMNCTDCVTDDATDGIVKRGRPRKLSTENQFFLFLCRVRIGLFELDLANRFSISISTVSNILITWANFLYLRLGVLNIWPTKEQVVKFMPESFKEKYPSTRVIIDCTELKIEMASSLLLKSQTYSNYKSTNTLKGLIGISPSGSVCFVSQLYTGCISDREITLRSGFLQLPFDNGDTVMADKGFLIQDLLDEFGVHLNIPPFLGMSGQMTGDDVATTQCVAAERIHVERAINKIKTFHIFNQVIPLSLAGSINQIWTVCALLTLFQEPIISTNKAYVLPPYWYGFKCWNFEYLVCIGYILKKKNNFNITS